MIIQVRGTSGSGKTWVMREVMRGTPGMWAPEYRPGRKRPILYRNGRLTVLGHYETPCGGCDSLGSARAVFEALDGSEVILCEGLLLSEDVKWTAQMAGVRVIFLTTSLNRCLRQIEERRLAAGNEKPLNPANTSNRVATIERARVRLMELGVECRRCPPEQAPGLIWNWIHHA